MLTLLGAPRHGFCDGLARRSFLRIGGLGTGSLCVPSAAFSKAPTGDSTPTRSVIMIYLPGGPTQHETFDPKPNAPVEIRGSYSPISTSLPGVQFCELLPKLSRIAHRFSIIRTLVGMQNRHESFQCYTGRPGGRPGDSEPAGGWPTFGSVASLVLGPGRQGMLPYVDAAPKMGYGPYNNRGLHDASGKVSWPGFTGRSHIPLALEGDVQSDLVLNGIDPVRFDHRRKLLAALRRREAAGQQDSVSNFQQRAFGLLTSSRLAEALDLKLEDPRTLERYGKTQKTDPSFGGAPQSPQHLLLARRLVEVGVRCVTVSFGAWDWHANREGSIEYLSRKYLPTFDHALSVFLDDLQQRGLAEHVTVVVWGEFGRTPRINAKGGRDHWPGTQSVLITGGGLQTGQIVGATDPSGGRPEERPVHVQEVFATLYQQLGIDVNQIKIPDLNGRPRYLVEANRRPIRELA